MPDVNWYQAADLRPNVLVQGDEGEKVEAMQRALTAAGFQLKPDGDFGPATARALRAFQKRHGLVADGIAGPKTLAALENVDTTYLLGQGDIERAAEVLGVDVPAVMAVNEVESRGSGFLSTGLPAILFERHIMRRRLAHHRIASAPWEASHPEVVNRSPGGYRGGTAEHDRLEVAKGIDHSAAIESASWGLFQIMGFHYALLGFDSPQDMERAAAHSEGLQLDMFVAFVKAHPAMHRALRAHDWAGFARRYNGPAYHINSYDTRMADAYGRHASALREAA